MTTKNENHNDSYQPECLRLPSIRFPAVTIVQGDP